MIRVDPHELTASAGVIRSCAVELSDVSAQLASCVGCPMPPELTPVVSQLVQTIDQRLEEVALALNAEAADLNNRAAFASSDLAAASSVASPLISTTAAIAGASSIGAGMGLIGGSNFSSTFGSSSMTIGGGMGFIGGHSPSPITIIDPMTGLEATHSSMIVGGGIRRGGSTMGILNDAIRVHSDRAAALRSKILNNSASTQSDIINANNVQIAHNENIARGLVTSKSTMESKKGRLLTMGEYYDLVPEARPPTGSFI